MRLFWDIFYWLIPIWTFVMIPFSTFYYEADDGMLMAGTSVGAKPNSRLCEAIKYQIVVLIIVGLLFGLTFLFLNVTDIPVREYNGTIDGAEYQIDPIINQTNASDIPDFQSSQLNNMTTEDVRVMDFTVRNPELGSVQLQTSVSTFFAGLMAWLGWFFFALFGGVGLAAMPLDLILRFVNRPRHMDAVEFAEAELSIRERVNELVDIGELIKIDRDERANNGGRKKGFFSCSSRDERKEKREEKKTLLQFKQAVYLLEQDVEDFKNCSSNYQNYNPLIPYAALLFGVIAFVVSICWVLHIILYVVPKGANANPVTPFLNGYFMWFDRWFPLFGVLSVAIFTFYLMLCAVKGNFKFGLRFLFFTIHPMKVNGTYMSSFLFNTGLVLLCALPIVQFCVTAFDTYARNATVNQTFGTQIQYLRFFRYFWVNNVFVYILLAFSVLTAIYLGCKPRDTSSDSLELRDRLKSRRA
mmetsp:Transcript_46851/g.86960  ORF Transcript_46851/g.86960 Transcript_46851/m.86960 type:complete len:470 (-) Transcript_46851:438-1847(-)